MSPLPSPDDRASRRAVLVHDCLRRSAQRDPDAVALIAGSERFTYHDLDRLSNQAANVMVEAGVGHGDRVLIAVENGPDFIACYFGAMKAGAVAVPVAGGPRNDRLRHVVHDCQPKVCVLDGVTAAREAADGGLTGVSLVLVGRGTVPAAANVRSLSASLTAAASSAPPERAIDRQLAAIIYTSGSTGEPRGVMLTHRNIVANTESIAAYLQLDARDRGMCVLPFHYVYGLSQLHTHLAVGGSLVIENRFVFPNVVLETMREQRVTGFAGVPSTFALLLHRSSLKDMTFPDLRYVTQAGGHMAPSRIRQWLDEGPKVPFYVMYGATEASARLTYLPPQDLERKLGSIGKAIPGVEIVIVDDDGREIADGQPGELVARGANISCGYWNDPVASQERFTSIGYRTGDIGYKDEDGFLFLVGRRHDMIKVGANRIGSAEVENVLHQQPDVVEAAVIGVPHELLGEVPVAFVSLRPGAVPAREPLLAFCRARLAPYKVPVAVFFRPELPKTSVGKIDKVTLRALALRMSLQGQPTADNLADSPYQA